METEKSTEDKIPIHYIIYVYLTYNLYDIL